jgi:uncharacterized protein (DUF58 family)
MPGARTTLALALALILCAAAFDAVSLYVPGVALALLAAGALAWVESTTRTVRLERARGPASVVEGDPYVARLLIRKGALALLGELRDPLLDRPLPVRLGPGARVEPLTVEARFGRRGRHRIGAAKLLVRDPLSLRARELQSDEGGELVVLPRIEPVLAGGGGRAGLGRHGLDGSTDGGGSGAIDLRPLDVEVDGLRPYREGSPASRIHWPAAARTGELLERRLVSGLDNSPLVVLDASGPASTEALDAAVRAAASLCFQIAGAAGCLLLLPGEARPLAIDPQLRSWPQAHAELAVVAPGHGPGLLPLRRTGSGAAFWVTACESGPPRRLLSRLAGSSLYLVSPVALPGAAIAFEVAGCHGQRLRARAAARGASAEVPA